MKKTGTSGTSRQERQGTGRNRPPVCCEENSGIASKNTSVKKELAGFLCLLLALALFCGGAQRVLIPKRHDCGAVWGMYLKEPEDSIDVLFFGTSIAYSNIVPAVLYEETGIPSFLMAGPDQTIPVTYRYLREACKTQLPQAVLIEADHFLWPGVHPSDKINLAYMPWSAERLIPTFQNTSGEDRLGLLFPLYAYHSRWDELTAQDWKEGLLGYETDSLAGYTFLSRVSKAEDLQSGERTLSSSEDYAKNLEYAGKIGDFCRERGIRLVYFLAPGFVRGGEELLREDLLKACPDAAFLDCGEDMDKMGLDPSADFYDAIHFNYRGAEKFSRYLADKLSAWGVSPSGKEDKALWKKRMESFSTLRDEADGKLEKSSRPGK